MIETIVVLLIIGILSAVGVPKIYALAYYAKNAVNQGFAGSFKSGLQLSHSQWMTKHSPSTGSTVVLGDMSIPLNGLGWPDNNKGTSPAPVDCYTILNQILSNAPDMECDGCSTECSLEAVEECYVVTSSGSVCSWVNAFNPGISFSYNLSNGDVNVSSSE